MQNIFNRLMLSLLTGIAGYASSEFSKLVTSVEKLNVSMAVMVEKYEQQSHLLQVHNQEIEKIKKARKI